MTNKGFVHKHTGPELWTEALKGMMNMSAVDDASTTFRAAWSSEGFASRIREDLGLCLFGQAYFNSQYARHLFASYNFKGEYVSWKQERDKLHKQSLGQDTS